MDFPALPSEDITEPAGLVAALGATPVPVARNRHDHLVELANAATERALTPDVVALARLENRAVVATAAADDGNVEGADFVSRCSAPRVGIDEDPVTVGSLRPRPAWAPRIGRTSLVGHQVSARDGIVQVEVGDERVCLGGRAITVLRGALLK